MTIYLDNCCLNRPYDDQAAPRVRLEAEAIELILSAVAEARIKMVWSATVDTENNQNPFEERRTGIGKKNYASIIIQDTSDVCEGARGKASNGMLCLWTLLRLASAEAGGASHFLDSGRRHFKETRASACNYYRLTFGIRAIFWRTIMKTDTQIRNEGMTALVDRLGPAEATRFMTLIQREGFDYTKWRQNLFEGKNLDEIADMAVGEKKPDDN